MANKPYLVRDNTALITENPWHKLKDFTSARIALGRAGNSLPTNESLAFQLDHARAMDAVHCALDVDTLLDDLAANPMVSKHTPMPILTAHSKARDRFMYLQRPDFGRQLDETSWEALTQHASSTKAQYDLAIVVADGLSSTAIQRHAVPVVERVVKQLCEDTESPWSLAPITVVRQGRVAVGDDIGECLKAKIVMILIGERPGLSSPDSMGIYMTWAPARGAKESSRNCISNIRPEGLNYDDASFKACYLLGESRRLQISGVNLKDRSVTDEQSNAIEEKQSTNFLISSHD